MSLQTLLLELSSWHSPSFSALPVHRETIDGSLTDPSSTGSFVVIFRLNSRSAGAIAVVLCGVAW